MPRLQCYSLFISDNSIKLEWQNCTYANDFSRPAPQFQVLFLLLNFWVVNSKYAPEGIDTLKNLSHNQSGVFGITNFPDIILPEEYSFSEFRISKYDDKRVEYRMSCSDHERVPGNF